MTELNDVSAELISSRSTIQHNYENREGESIKNKRVYKLVEAPLLQQIRVQKHAMTPITAKIRDVTKNPIVDPLCSTLTVQSKDQNLCNQKKNREIRMWIELNKQKGRKRRIWKKGIRPITKKQDEELWES